MTNRYSVEVVRQGEAYEDSPERAQDKLAEALAVLRKTRDALMAAAEQNHLESPTKEYNGPFWTCKASECIRFRDALAKADALLARGGK